MYKRRFPISHCCHILEFFSLHLFWCFFLSSLFVASLSPTLEKMPQISLWSHTWETFKSFIDCQRGQVYYLHYFFQNFGLFIIWIADFTDEISCYYTTNMASSFTRDKSVKILFLSSVVDYSWNPRGRRLRRMAASSGPDWATEWELTAKKISK